MSVKAILFSEDQQATVPAALFRKYNTIVSDPHIHSGLPHIKGTRILVSDLFRAQIQGHDTQNIVTDFKEMGVNITPKQVDQAIKFTVQWLDYAMNETPTQKAAR